MLKKLLCLTMVVSLVFSLAVFTGISAGADSAEKIKVACVGDSITFGSKLQDPATESYPAQLQGILGDGYEVKNFGASGYSLLKNSKGPYWEAEDYRKSLEYQADIVIIMLGTNDIKTENWEAVERNNYIAGKDFFVDDYCEFIQTYKDANSNTKVFVCTPPPIYLDESDTERPPLNLRNYGVPLIKEAALLTGSTVIDIFSVMDNKRELFPDMLHPNAEGAKMIADAVYAAITSPSTEVSDAKQWEENLKNIPAFDEPYGELSREEFAYLIVNTFTLENKSETAVNFTDIGESEYKDEICAAYSNGIIKGTSDTEFNPLGKITRQEITVMLYRAWHVLYPNEDFTVINIYTFSDGDKIASWAKEAVIYMYDRKIMLGTSTETPTISPLDNIRKDHALLLLERIVASLV